MSLTMLVLLLISLACASQGRRVQILQSSSNEEHRLLQDAGANTRSSEFEHKLRSSRPVARSEDPIALARLLRASRSESAFNPSSDAVPHARVHTERHRSTTSKTHRAAQPRALVIPEGVELKTIGDRVLVDADTVPMESTGGILMPTVYQDRLDEFNFDVFDRDQGVQPGNVKSVGPGLRVDDGTFAEMPEITAGQKVLIAPGAGQIVKREGESRREEDEDEEAQLIVQSTAIWGVCGSGDGADEYPFDNYKLPGPVQALNNMVLLKPPPKKEELETGLLIVADPSINMQKEATVVSAGPGRIQPQSGKLLPNPCKVGDVVLLPEKFYGTEVTYLGEKHFFANADDLLGTFEGGEITPAAFRPFGNQVMVELAAAATKTVSGIVLAEADVSDQEQGEVFAVGPGLYSETGDIIEMEVKKGQSVLFRSRAADLIELDGKKFKLGSEMDVLSSW